MRVRYIIIIIIIIILFLSHEHCRAHMYINNNPLHASAFQSLQCNSLIQQLHSAQL